MYTYLSLSNRPSASLLAYRDFRTVSTGLFFLDYEKAYYSAYTYVVEFRQKKLTQKRKSKIRDNQDEIDLEVISEKINEHVILNEDSDRGKPG